MSGDASHSETVPSLKPNAEAEPNVNPNAAARSPLDRPPMLPSICSSPSFLYSTDLQLQDHAANPLLVAQLTDSLGGWLSHITDIWRELEDCERWLDAASVLHVHETAEKFRRMESLTAFHVHFDRPEPKVLTRCLSYHAGSQPALQRLDDELRRLRKLNAELGEAKELLELATGYFPANRWQLADIADAVGPLFTAFRGLYMGTAAFGPQHSTRFLALIFGVVQRTEETIHDSCRDVLERVTKLPKHAVRAEVDLVAAQDAAVSTQEAYYRLLEGVVEHAVDSKAAEDLFAGVDDEALFSVLTWQYHRCAALHTLIEALRKDENKIGSVLTERLDKLDLMSRTAIDQQSLLREVESVVTKAAPNPNAVLERMGVKQKGSGSKGPVNYAPRVTFESLSPLLSVIVAFNPPAVTISGGPISEKTLDAAAKALPHCCSNQNVTSLRRVLAPCKWEPVVGHATASAKFSPVVRLEINEQFCDAEVASTHFLATLMDLIEAEDAWSLTACHTHWDAARIHHTFIFARQRPWEGKE